MAIGNEHLGVGQESSNGKIDQEKLIAQILFYLIVRFLANPLVLVLDYSY